MKKLFTLLVSLMLLFSLFSFSMSFEASATKEGYFTYEMTGGNAILTKVDPAISGDVVVPVHLGNFDILYIAEEAFKDCTGITSITIPEEIDGVYFNAFKGCTNLTTVNFNCKAYSHKDSAGSPERPVFADCPNLTTVNIGAGVESIPKFLFYGVASLKTVNFAGDRPTIGQDAFAGCPLIDLDEEPVSSKPTVSKPTVSRPATSSKPISTKPTSSDASSEDTVSKDTVSKDTSSEIMDSTSSKIPTIGATDNSDDDGGSNMLIYVWIGAGAAILILSVVAVILLKK